jgi:hypothetical protein
MKIIKFAAVAAAIVAVSALSASLTRSYVTEVKNREKSLAEVIIAGNAAAAFEAEAKRAEDVIGTTATAVTTEVLPAHADVTDIPVTTTTAPITTTTPTTTAPVTTTTTETTTTLPEIVTDYKIGGLIDTSAPPAVSKTILLLTDTERAELTQYLIDHYFLDGFIYAEAETHPILRERKMAAAEMESAAVQTVNMIMSAVNIANPAGILETDFDALTAKVDDIKIGFAANYGNADFADDDMQALYTGSLAYFDQLSASLDKIKAVQTDYKNAANALLAAGLAAKALSDVVIPEVLSVLESSFDLVEASQPIFLENTTGHTLLTRDEVTAILTNPGYIL